MQCYKIGILISGIGVVLGRDRRPCRGHEERGGTVARRAGPCSVSATPLDGGKHFLVNII